MDSTSSFQAQPSRPPAVDLKARATSCKSPPVRKIQQIFLKQKMTNTIKKLLNRNLRMTGLTKVRHPSSTKLSIYKIRFNNNLRKLSRRIFSHKEGREAQPSIRSGTQILPKPPIPPSDTFISARDDNLTPVKTMQIRKNPNFPGMWRRNGTTWTKTTQHPNS